MTHKTTPPPENRFTISQDTIRLRRRNTILGTFLAIALGVVLWRFQAQSAPFNALLLGLMLLTLALLTVIQFAGTFRYLRRSASHHLEVGEDSLVFVTHGERTELKLQDVLLIDRQKRLGDAISLMMRLRNQRIVRLEGYERQGLLMDLVTERFERASSAFRQANKNADAQV